jgi:hypothetical protein
MAGDLSQHSAFYRHGPARRGHESRWNADTSGLDEPGRDGFERSHVNPRPDKIKQRASREHHAPTDEINLAAHRFSLTCPISIAM